MRRTSALNDEPSRVPGPNDSTALLERVLREARQDRRLFLDTLARASLPYFMKAPEPEIYGFMSSLFTERLCSQPIWLVDDAGQCLGRVNYMTIDLKNIDFKAADVKDIPNELKDTPPFIALVRADFRPKFESGCHIFVSATEISALRSMEDPKIFGREARAFLHDWFSDLVKYGNDIPHEPTVNLK